MAGMNIPVNVYDEKGTVLYRAVPYTVGPDGDLLAATFTGECGPSVACAASCASSMSRITAKSGRVHGVFGHAAHGKSAANTGEHATQSGLTEESLTPVVALAKLFPPKPLFPQQQPGQPQEGLQENTMTSDCWGQETEGEPTWMKVAAVDHTSRLDCVHLQDHLERRCRQEHARPLGVVCSTREGIYTEGFEKSFDRSLYCARNVDCC
ncbi:putative Axonemal dynein light chain [Trypanosoma vivax]|nr:putative Axonemal dynein light chain [Trypanosoma vivax]